MKKLILCLLLFVGCKEDDSPAPVIPPATTVTDVDGNVYHMVTIGTQVWMVENLKVTKYNDGTPIPLVEDSANWSKLSTPGYCWYKNDAANKVTYGALYNWYAVNTGKLAPEGWHVPSDSEWTVLTTYLGGEAVAGGKLKEADTTHWSAPNTGATNSSGFTALPGGYRTGGTFFSIGTLGYWWSSTEYSSVYAKGRFMLFFDADASHYYNYKSNGYSVRCVRD